MINAYISLLLLSAFYYSIVIVYKSIVLNNIKTKHFMFIQYVSGFLLTLIYGILYFLNNSFIHNSVLNSFFNSSYSIKKEDLIEIFNIKNKKIWIFFLVTTLLGTISQYFYYESLNKLGPTQYQIISSVSKILFMLFISIFVLKNQILNYKIYMGVLFGIMTIYFLNETTNDIQK